MSQKKATSCDVAERAGVSQATVSLILNGSSKVGFSEQTRQRVFEAAEELGYHLPARKNGKKQTNRLILVLIPTLTNQYYSELVQSLEQYADTLGFRMLVCNTFRKQELEKFYLERFVNEDISGVIYSFLPNYPQKILQLAKHTPFVLIGEKTEDLPICSIELSNQKAGALLAEHLYTLGHRRVTFISTPMNQMTLARGQRLDGIRHKFQELGQRDGTEVCVETVAAPGMWEADSVMGGLPYECYVGQSLTEELLKNKCSATALIGANDMIAFGILRALRNNGYRVPEDFAVCGFDNTFSSSIVLPGLTTIDHKLWARCRLAVDMIAEQNAYLDVQDNSILMANKVEYSPQLIVRSSTQRL